MVYRSRWKIRVSTALLIAMSGQASSQTVDRYIHQPNTDAGQATATPGGDTLPPPQSSQFTAHSQSPQLTGRKYSDPSPSHSEDTPRLKWVSVAASGPASAANARQQSINPAVTGNAGQPGNSSSQDSTLRPEISSPIQSQVITPPRRQQSLAIPAETAAYQTTTGPTIRAASSASTENQLQASARQARGQMVSTMILNDPNFARADNAQTQIGPIAPPPGWQAVGEQLSRHLAACELLLRRGALYSARSEVQTASVQLIRHIDLITNSYTCEPAWQAAQQALEEADDFMQSQSLVSDGDLLKRLIDSHQTPIMKGTALSGVSPLAVAQHYRRYAEENLSIASQQHPWASELFYALGKTYQTEANQSKYLADALRERAVTYYRVACRIDPKNAVACNELGYLLLQMDRPQDAREPLIAAVSAGGPDAAFQNLAEAGRRLNDVSTQNWAAQQLANRRGSRPAVDPNVPDVLLLEPRQFAAMSPYSIGPQPNTAMSSVPPTALNPDANGRTAQSAGRSFR